MKLTVLGCMGAYPYQGRGTTGFLLEAQDFHLLIDAGSGTLLELEKHLSPLALDAVILSHYHHDHIADVGVLQYMWQLDPQRDQKRVLPIYGHQDDERHFAELTMANVSQGLAYQPDQVLEIGPFTITFLKTLHSVPCYGMRIVETETGKVLVFTGDSGFLADFEEFAQQADLFLADTYLFAGNEGHHAHFTSKEAGEIAQVAEVKQLVLTHLPQHGSWAQLQQEAFQATKERVPVALAEVGKTFDI